MKAYELRPTEGFPPLHIVERPSPRVGPRDVRVRMRAASLNYRDIVMARNARKRTSPLVPVSDGAGEVVEIGADVTRVKPGDQVMGAFFPTWIDGELKEEHHSRALGGSIDGVLAEEIVLAESAWVKVPAGRSSEQASTLPCAGVTAWHALFVAAALRPGIPCWSRGRAASRSSRCNSRAPLEPRSSPRRAPPTSERC
jgi:NADPH:quinone reductase-like Zn-dependent oxidoreductase